MSKKVISLKTMAEAMAYDLHEDQVILIEEVVIAERGIGFGLYYWPWKNEFVIWTFYFGLTNTETTNTRDFNHGAYFKNRQHGLISPNGKYDYEVIPGSISVALNSLYKRVYDQRVKKSRKYHGLGL